MAKSGNGGQGYAPLNYFDRLKIRAATKHLHSRYVSVRNAAHREIQRILQRRQQARGRLDPRKLARQAWQRVNHGKLHQCGNCGHATRDKDMFRQHVNGHQREAGEAVRSGPAATPGLRERQGHAKSPARTPETRRPATARTPDMRLQAGLLPQDQKRQPDSQKRQQPRPASRPGPVTNATLRQEARDRRAAARPASPPRTPAAPATTRTPLDVVGRPDVRAPSVPKLAPLPHETVRAPSAVRVKPRLRMPRLRARA